MDLSCPLLSNAVNTIALANLASAKHDQRLVHESQEAYGKTLSQLVRSLDRSYLHKPRYKPRDVVASILLLSFYNEGTMISDSSAKNHLAHLRGAADYAGACGPDSFDLSCPFDSKMFRYLRPQSMLAGVAARKSVTWARIEWREAAVGSTPALSAAPPFSDLHAPLAGLLEQADKLLRIQKERQPLRADLCRALAAYRKQVLDSIEGTLAHDSWIVSVDDLSQFDMSIEEHCVITTNTTFPKARWFVERRQAFEARMAWIFCLISDCTVLRLLYSSSPLQKCEIERILGKSTKDIENSTFEIVKEICRVVAYFSTSKSLPDAQFNTTYLEMARRFYEEYGAIKEIGWCQACLIAAELRVARLKSVNQPTLCRVADLAPGFIGAIRYRRPHQYNLQAK